MLKEKTISATEFKAKCLGILDRLEPNGVVVTKHGRPIAKVLPLSPHASERFIGSMKGKIKIKGDLFSTGIRWDAESRYAHRGRTSKRRSKRG